MIADVTVRALRAADIPALAGVLARAYISKQDFERRLNSYLQMRSVATFIAEREGKPIGMVVGNDYGRTAYVSQMAVEPSLQRRGIGGVLMSGLIAWANKRNFDGIELDATPAGAPLYAHYGFVGADQTVVYESVGPGGDPRAAPFGLDASFMHPSTGAAAAPRSTEAGAAPRSPGAAAAQPYTGVARPYAHGDRDALFAADYRAFGADRRDVLRLLIDSTRDVVVVMGRHGAVDGFAIAQPRADLLGPVVAPDAVAAACLIDAARTHVPGPHRVCVPAENRVVHGIVAARGYRVSRSLVHMLRGTRPHAARHEIFARINLGQG